MEWKVSAEDIAGELVLTPDEMLDAHYGKLCCVRDDNERLICVCPDLRGPQEVVFERVNFLFRISNSGHDRGQSCPYFQNVTCSVTGYVYPSSKKAPTGGPRDIAPVSG